MTAVNPALVEFNKRNVEFWADQKVLMDRRMAERAILETAIERITSEGKRRISIPKQVSFEEALQDAEKTKRRFVGQFARSGGKAAKADPLHALIEGIVRQTPKIALEELLNILRQRQGDGIIDEIDDARIYFKSVGSLQTNKRTPERAGDEDLHKIVTSYSAPISGLKHRLTRARKKIFQERWSR